MAADLHHSTAAATKTVPCSQVSHPKRLHRGLDAHRLHPGPGHAERRPAADQLGSGRQHRLRDPDQPVRREQSELRLLLRRVPGGRAGHDTAAPLRHHRQRQADLPRFGQRSGVAAQPVLAVGLRRLAPRSHHRQHATGTRPPTPRPSAASTTSNSVYVLDAATLKITGHVDGLGKGERLYAVRFLGALGYVVTYNQVDPLYVLDLADPQRPRVVRITPAQRVLQLPARHRFRPPHRRRRGHHAGERGRRRVRPPRRAARPDVRRQQPEQAGPDGAHHPVQHARPGRVRPARLPVLATDRPDRRPGRHLELGRRREGARRPGVRTTTCSSSAPSPTGPAVSSRLSSNAA